jgi:hypothetical protein
VFFFNGKTYTLGGCNKTCYMQSEFMAYDSEQDMAPISSYSPHIWSKVSLERANSLKAHTGG